MSTSSLLPEDLARLSPEAFQGDLEDIGWKDLSHDDPAVCELRDQLRANAGIPDLETIDPALPGYAERAAFLLERDGFVVVLNVLEPIAIQVTSIDAIIGVIAVLAVGAQILIPIDTWAEGWVCVITIIVASAVAIAIHIVKL